LERVDQQMVKNGDKASNLKKMPLLAIGECEGC
jgi:hypothetical protein